VKRLLLLGGGHSHVEVLRRFGARPMSGAEITLVSPAPLTPYTGMLPGLLAGHYQYHDCHIDLEALARFAGARFVQSLAQTVDTSEHRVILADGSTLDYDVVSIDVGAVPATGGVAGALENALSIKPFESFLPAWDRLIERARSGGIRRLAVVGGGAGGVEVLLAAQYRLAREPLPLPLRLSLVTDASELLPTHAAAVGAAFRRILSTRHIDVHFRTRVARLDRDGMIAATGDRIPADAVIWATGAAPPPLLHAIPVALDAAGFISVTPNLQSISDSTVFAAGDCATIAGFRYPKAGVYAVRQGPPLAANLRRMLAGQPLVAYTPQRRALALISSGERCAVASYGGLKLEGAWVWRWKDHIDRGFIARYRNLPRAGTV
jgi:selenide,water dikinase